MERFIGRFLNTFLSNPPVSAGILQPQAERVAIEALQICTLLLPPSSRRKLQLLMRMMCRISQNVDMPRLHPAIGTRTLVRLDFRETWGTKLFSEVFVTLNSSAVVFILSGSLVPPFPRWSTHFQAASWAVL